MSEHKQVITDTPMLWYVDGEWVETRPLGCTYTSARPSDGTRPTRGYVQYLAMEQRGGRWPSVVYRVLGEIDGSKALAMLTANGEWRWFDGSQVFTVPDECNLSQAQLGDALGAAGCGPGLPLISQTDGHYFQPITYTEPVLRPAKAMAAEEWRPDAPKWRGGKPWR